jgi:hypothetical protein
MPPSSNNALHHLLLSEELCPENFLSGWKRQRDSPEHSGTVRDVRSMTFDEMRSRLVEHFDIQFRRGKIVWPRRVTPPRSV